MAVSSDTLQQLVDELQEKKLKKEGNIHAARKVRRARKKMLEENR